MAKALCYYALCILCMAVSALSQVASLTDSQKSDILSLRRADEPNSAGKFVLEGDIEDLRNRATNWCRSKPNKTDSNYNKLGFYKYSDECCRDYAYCFKILEDKQEQNEVVNNEGYDVYHCECDVALKKCLNTVNSVYSKLLVDSLIENPYKCLTFNNPWECSGEGSKAKCCRDTEKKPIWQLISSTYDSFVL